MYRMQKVSIVLIVVVVDSVVVVVTEFIYIVSPPKFSGKISW